MSRPFPHEKLRACPVALSLIADVRSVADAIPKGHRQLADQMLRAATSVALNLGEGANRLHPKEQAQRYNIARGECGGLAVALDISRALGFADSRKVELVKSKAASVYSRLTVLLKAAQKRA